MQDSGSLLQAIAAQTNDELDGEYWFWKLVQAFWLGAFERDGYCATKLLLSGGTKGSPDEIYRAEIDDDTFTRDDTRNAWLRFAPGSLYQKKLVTREERALRKQEALRCKKFVEAGGGKAPRHMVRGWFSPKYSRILPDRPSFEQLAITSDPDTLISNRASIDDRFSKFFREAYLDQIIVETVAVKAWLKRPASGKAIPRLPPAKEGDVKNKILAFADGNKSNATLKKLVEDHLRELGWAVSDHSRWTPALRAARKEHPDRFLSRGARKLKSGS